MKIEVNLSVKNLENNEVFSQNNAGGIPVAKLQKNVSSYTLDGKNEYDTLRMLILNVVATFLSLKYKTNSQEYADNLIVYKKIFNLDYKQ